MKKSKRGPGRPALLNVKPRVKFMLMLSTEQRAHLGKLSMVKGVSLQSLISKGVDLVLAKEPK